MPRPPVLVGSHMRVNLVTEAQSVLPSLTSAFSIESMVERQPYYMAPQSEVLRRRVLPDPNDDYYRDVTSSCQNFDDPYENPTYTDTVKSTDSTGSALRRSISVPPEYTFKTSAANSRRHAREVFEEYFKMLENDSNDNQNSNQDIEGALEADEESDVVASQGAESAAGGGAGAGKKWRQTMTDLLENPEYVDSIESTSSGAVLLARSAVSLGNKQGEIVSTAMVPRVPRVPEEGEHLKYVKNLVILGFSFFFIFGPYLSVRNLQSSIIEDSTLAFFALSAIYASLFVGCIFATTIVQRLRPKRTMLLCMCSYVFYVAANYYPHYYTLVPAAFAVGFCMGNLWTAQATYLTNIAACYAETTGKTLRNVVSKFNGMFFGIFGVSQIVGGIISSTVLMNQHVTTDLVYTWPNTQNVFNATHDSTEYLMYNPDTDSVYPDDSYAVPAAGDDVGGVSKGNATFPAPQVECGAEFCNSRQKPVTSSLVDTHILYILLAIYGGLMLVGIMITLCFLDPLEGVMARSHDSFCDQMTAVFKWFVDYRVACLAGIGFYSLISMSFMFGEFYKAFVTCPLGVHMVGYAMICMSAANSISSYVNGRVQKFVGQLPLFLLAGLIDLALLVAMLLWQPSLDTLPVLFVIVGFWGLAEAILFIQLISLFAVVFKDKKEAAFSGLKMFQSLGACLNFATAKYMCTRTKIYIVGGLLVWAMLGVTLLEIITNRKERREKEAEAVCDDSLPSKSPPPADSGGTQNGVISNGSAPGTEKKPLGPTPV